MMCSNITVYYAKKIPVTLSNFDVTLISNNAVELTLLVAPQSISLEITNFAIDICWMLHLNITTLSYQRIDKILIDHNFSSFLLPFI